MVGWASSDPRHQGYLKKAKDFLAKGEGSKLVGVNCWLDETPISAQTYPTICEAGRAVDIYGRGKEPSLGKVQVPVVIVYGDVDIGIKMIDGTIEKWMERVDKIKDKSTKIEIIVGASHSFRGYEGKLAKSVENFVKSLVLNNKKSDL